MTIEKIISCDICKRTIIPESLDSISVVGNVSVTSISNVNGIGDGLFGNVEWLRKIDHNKSLKLCDVPISHLHIQCIANYIKPNKRD
jgi:hypothetical protein